MRFIIHELPYERPLLAGRLRYERDGRPTGAVESWRLTDAVDGYRFLRVDLDAREAPSGRSWLYHTTLNPDGRPEQLKYRFWGDKLEVSGTLVREGDEWIGRRTVNDVTYENVAGGEAFWFPSAVGLTLLRHFTDTRSAVTLTMETNEPARFLSSVETNVTSMWGDGDQVQVDGVELIARPLSIKWGGNHRVVWLDDDGQPLRLWRDDELTAAAERLVRYSG